MYGRNMEERARRNVYERVCEERKLADRMWSSEMCDHRTVSITIKNFVVWKLIVPERHERQKYIYVCISRGDNNDVLVKFIRWFKNKLLPEWSIVKSPAQDAIV